jgi:predicted tellurium resistance membrane protein TerC
MSPKTLAVLAVALAIVGVMLGIHALDHPDWNWPALALILAAGVSLTAAQVTANIEDGK